LSKHDGYLKAAGDAAAQLDEVLVTALDQGSRHYALAQYLSGADGWQGAQSALRGTFATAAVPQTGLTEGKEK